MFRRAAYYDSQAAHVPFQAIKEGGNRNQVGVNPDEFKRLIAGDEQVTEQDLNRKQTSQLTQESIVNQPSGRTTEADLLNIGIVEMTPMHV